MRNVEAGVKFIRIAILFPRMHAKYSKQFLYYNQKLDNLFALEHFSMLRR